MGKKLIALFAVCALALGLCACGPSAATENASEETKVTWQEQYDLGVRYLSGGNYQEAILAFTAAIEIGPKQAPAYLGRAQAYILSGEVEDNFIAIENDFKTVIELDYTVIDAWIGLADLYMRNGEYSEAITVLREAMERLGNDWRIEDKIEDISQLVIWEVDCETTWDSKLMENVIREYIGKPTGSILRSDLDNISAISIGSHGITVGWVNSNETSTNSGYSFINNSRTYYWFDGDNVPSFPTPNDIGNFRNLLFLELDNYWGEFSEESLWTTTQGLEKCVMIEVLILVGHRLVDLDGTGELRHLRELDIRNNRQLNSFRGLENSKNLYYLCAIDVGTSRLIPYSRFDLSALTTLPNLRSFSFEDHPVDFEIIGQITTPEELSLTNCFFYNWESISHLTNLRSLTCQAYWDFFPPDYISEFIDTEEIDNYFEISTAESFNDGDPAYVVRKSRLVNDEAIQYIGSLPMLEHFSLGSGYAVATDLSPVVELMEYNPLEYTDNSWLLSIYGY